MNFKPPGNDGSAMRLNGIGTDLTKRAARPDKGILQTARPARATGNCKSGLIPLVKTRRTAYPANQGEAAETQNTLLVLSTSATLEPFKEGELCER